MCKKKVPFYDINFADKNNVHCLANRYERGNATILPHKVVCAHDCYENKGTCCYFCKIENCEKKHTAKQKLLFIASLATFRKGRF